MYQDYLMVGLSRGATLLMGAPLRQPQAVPPPMPQSRPRRHPLRGVMARLGAGLVRLGERLSALDEARSPRAC